MQTSFYSEEELVELGLNSFGQNVLISRNAMFYGLENISIGDNVRIDDFCIISASGKIKLENYIHIGAYTSIIGEGNIYIHNFASISGRVSIYSSSDNYTGLGMTNPMIPHKYRKVEIGEIILKEHSIIGAGSVLLPKTVMDTGSVIGALSLARGHYDAFKIYSGNPTEFIGKRIDIKIKKYEKLLKK